MAFRVLMRILMSIVKILNEEGFKLYDDGNPEWYLSDIKYDSKRDKLYFTTRSDD